VAPEAPTPRFGKTSPSRGSEGRSWKSLAMRGPSSLAKLVTIGELGFMDVASIVRRDGKLTNMTRRPRLWKWMTIQWKWGDIDQPSVEDTVAGKGNSPDSGYTPMSSNMAGWETLYKWML